MWKLSCGRCGYGAELEEWAQALKLAIFHANEWGHWGAILLRRPVDDAGYVLKTWGTERRLLKKVA